MADVAAFLALAALLAVIAGQVIFSTFDLFVRVPLAVLRSRPRRGFGERSSTQAVAAEERRHDSAGIDGEGGI